ncbi:zinc-ribbon domain-containing protein [Bacillus sp. NPDC077411]|uniref:zinc-ribbon domain-containing protein n=1 Tax=Bacillus sp. NPDC077411 TaxID=3363947 RepID=UPI0037C722AF
MKKFLSDYFPNVSKEWHPTKNGELKPSDVTYGSGKRVWWVCSEGHEWETVVSQRTNKKATGCPYCSGKKVNNENSFKVKYPELVKEWHSTKNGDLLPNNFTAGSKKRVWWTCSKGHEWQTTISERSRGRNCPYCTGRKLTKENSLYEKYPEIANQWHPNKNDKLRPQDVSAKSSKKIWWLCKRRHEWQTAVSERTRGYGCPYCSGKYISEDNNLKAVYPEIAKEWNYTKNVGLFPEEVYCNSSKRVWWKCKKGHEWEIPVRNRTKSKTNCPYCAGKKASADYNLQKFYPLIAAEWDVGKNSNLRPSEFTPSSGKSVWWIGTCGHTYKSQIASRIRGQGCPYCAGKKVLIENSLLIKFPEVANEWDYQKNKAKKPEQFLPGSMEIVWWKCNKAHSWRASINNRTYKSSKCPKCFGATSFPEQAIFFYIKQLFPDAVNRYLFENKLEIDVFIPSRRVAIEYDGLYFHSKEENVKRDISKNKKLYDARIQLIRIRNPEAPKIEKYNCLLIDIEDDKDILNIEVSLHKLLRHLNVENKIEINLNKDYGSIVKQMGNLPIEKTVASEIEIVMEWHPYKNGDLLPHMILKGSKKKVWWKCTKDHEWEAAVDSRVNRKTRCPYCINKKTSPENSLVFTYPEIATEWDYDKNGSLSPKDVVAGSSRRIWWKCKKGHEWKNRVVHRTARNQKCPYCLGLKASPENNLFITHPDLVKEWDYNKNINITPYEVTYGSIKKVWWKCKKGHEWETSVNSRTTHKQGCPYCSNRKVCSDNCLTTTKPLLSKEWHPIKNSPLTPSNVLAGSTKKVWWVCQKGHEWEATINSRSRGSGCPHCYKLRRKKGEHS